MGASIAKARTKATPGAAGPAPAGCDIVFYDGGCGFCHRTVLHLLAADPDGSRFVYAPIGGDTFEALVPGGTRPDLPDSVIVRTEDGRVLMRTAGAIHLGRRLGGAHAALARILGLVPAFLRDAAYDAFARIRHRLFARPVDACPLVPPELRGRFLA